MNCLACNQYSTDTYHPECKPSDESERLLNDMVRSSFQQIIHTLEDSQYIHEKYYVTESEVECLLNQFKIELSKNKFDTLRIANNNV